MILGIVLCEGDVMPRPLRIEYAGARYHVMSPGDRREAIFHDDADWQEFLRTLGQEWAAPVMSPISLASVDSKL